MFEHLTRRKFGNEVEIVTGGGFGQQKLKLYEVISAKTPRKGNNNEADILSEKLIVGTERAVKAYMKYDIASEYRPGCRFRWLDKSTYSARLDKKWDITIYFDHISRARHLDAVVLS